MIPGPRGAGFINGMALKWKAQRSRRLKWKSHGFCVKMRIEQPKKIKQLLPNCAPGKFFETVNCLYFPLHRLRCGRLPPRAALVRCARTSLNCAVPTGTDGRCCALRCRRSLAGPEQVHARCRPRNPRRSRAGSAPDARPSSVLSGVCSSSGTATMCSCDMGGMGSEYFL